MSNSLSFFCFNAIVGGTRGTTMTNLFNCLALVFGMFKTELVIGKSVIGELVVYDEATNSPNPMKPKATAFLVGTFE